MATTITGISQNKVISNLDTYNHTALNTSVYTVAVQMQENPPSGLVVTIQQNGVTKATTSVAPAAAQSVVDLQAQLSCASGDLISVVLSSSNPSDSNINTVKGILKISVGLN